MSRFTVGQEITPKETGDGFTRGEFYKVIAVDRVGISLVNDDLGRPSDIPDVFFLTREEYEQAEREKDPFAPGKWVVCVFEGYGALLGEIIKTEKEHDTTCVGWFCSNLSNYPKSHFHPATPEEIKEQEMKLTGEKKEGEDSRQEFTVDGQTFYVGQTVWAEKDGFSFSKADELEVIGPISNAPLALCVRKPSSSLIYFTGHAAVTTTKPKPHEWKFGDWARHPECGVLFVTGIGDEDEDGDREIEAAMKDGTVVVLGDAELTYISTAEIPE